MNSLASRQIGWYHYFVDGIFGRFLLDQKLYISEEKINMCFSETNHKHIVFFNVFVLSGDKISPCMKQCWLRFITSYGGAFRPKFVKTASLVLEYTTTTRTPAFWGYPLSPHDNPYFWVIFNPKAIEDKVEATNLKNLPKFQIFGFWNRHYTWHTFWGCLTPFQLCWSKGYNNSI